MVERPGEEAPNGVGSIRALHVVGPPIREEVLEYEPPHKFTYRIVSGVPVRSQVGTVVIAESGKGTLMSYEIVIEPLVPFTGATLAAAMERGIRALLDGVAAEAERRADG